MSKPTFHEENKLHRQGYNLIAGADEAGRGAWAGPLVAAAVILPQPCQLKGINDSKKLKPHQREALYTKITKVSVAWSTEIISHKEIDRRGVGQANLKALKQSVANLKKQPDTVLVDGFNIVHQTIPHRGIIKGDAKVTSIAAASIIAKVTRDRLMVNYHKKYPDYGFHLHKGYGTALHQQRLKKYGLSPIHRRSFRPIRMLANR